jgi:hypothetical protein
MKIYTLKILVLACLLLLVNGAYCQWYTRRYNVTDINQLSGQQLDESLHDFNKGMLYSGMAVVMGGAGILVIRYGEPSVDEDSPLLEQLIGEKGMDAIGTVLCAGIAAGGVISGLDHFGRTIRIRKAIRRNYPYIREIDISAVFCTAGGNMPVAPGLALVFRF